ncbi:MAG: phosphate ABC transporter substrate-binding protein PstS [Casimicrobiaceae bacterium]
MRTSLRGIVVATAFACASAGTIGTASAAGVTGVGSTFAYPIFARWAAAYHAEGGVEVNYQSIGSGAGIAQIEANTVDFGASDMPLTAAGLDRAGLIQFPAIIGGVVPVVNVRGVVPGALKLTGRLLAAIYLGRIKSWNDSAIAEHNPGLALPAEPITVVRRSDGSGTTFIWTNYLSKVSSEWKDQVGSSTAVSWPEGVGGKGNEGVAAYVQRIKGSIGYVEYAFAKKNAMAYALVANHEGAWVQPGIASFQAAAAYADWTSAPGFHVIITDQPGEATWPITGATFVLLHRTPRNPAGAEQVLKFFDWSFHHGRRMAEELDYVPLPPNVVTMIAAAWRAGISDSAGKSIGH